MHGLFGSGTNWSGIARQLSTDYYVLVPDLRNHGRSPHTELMTYTAMTHDLIALLDKEQLKQATLIGHSMGGKLAMRLALLAPQRITALAVVDIAPVTYKHNFDKFFNTFNCVDLNTIKSRADAQQQMANHQLEESLQCFLLQNLRKTGHTWEWRINLAALRTGQQAVTSFDAPLGCCYNRPAWFIHGTQSDYVRPAYGATISAYFPQATYHPIADAGHWVHTDQPQLFMQTLQQCLAS
jgi:pimeloyl-ACP methyl ester carboxylesterase